MPDYSTSEQSSQATFFHSDPHDIYSSGDDSSLYDPYSSISINSRLSLQQSRPSGGPIHLSGVIPPRSAPTLAQRSSMHVLDPMNPGSLGEATPHTKRRPKYTRSKAGCLTCRTKKIKCDEVKPICTRCEHAQRECTWPTETSSGKKKSSRRPRISNSPEDAPIGGPGHSGRRAVRSSRSPARSSSRSSVSEDTGSTLSGTSFDDGFASYSGSESGDELGRMMQPGPHAQFPPLQTTPQYTGYPPTQQSSAAAAMTGTYPPPQVYPQYPYGQAFSLSGIPYNINNETGPRIDMAAAAAAGLNLPLPALSASSSPSQISMSPSPASFYPASGLAHQQSLNIPYVLSPTTNIVPSYDPSQQQYQQMQQFDPSKWSSITAATTTDSSSYQQLPSGYPYNTQLQETGALEEQYNNQEYDDSESNSNSHSFSSPPSSLSPESAASPEEQAMYAAANATATSMARGQWGNTSLIMAAGPDPIEPFFKTPKERNLIRHYANFSTDLIMAVHTSAALNPVLASTLPIVLSVLPRQSAPIEALRLSLLGVASVHQAFLHSRAVPGRSFLEHGALGKTDMATKNNTNASSAKEANEMLRLGLLLRHNATQCLAFAVQSPDGSFSDAALAASASIALIDIFAGGRNFQENLKLAKVLLDIRGGPEGIIANNAPSRTSFGGGVNVSPARLLLEILAVYDTFGSLTSGDEPLFLGGDRNRSSWWFQGDEWSYHKYSVEKVFAMSRQAIFLVAKVSSLITRAGKISERQMFTEAPPSSADDNDNDNDGDHGKKFSPAARALHEEARQVLSELEEEARSELAAKTRFIEVGADEDLAASEAGDSSTNFKALAAQRIEHGSQAHMMAFQIAILRQIFNVDRNDPRIQRLSEEVLQRCLDSAAKMGMSVDLTWPTIIAGSQVDGSQRSVVAEIFEGFRKKCCFDIDTAEQIVNQVWFRADHNLPGADWKSVLVEAGVQVLLL